MRPYIFWGVLCCMLPLCSCNAPISRDRLAEITIEMYLFEQKIQDHPDLNLITDTTLVYAAILQKHGYSVNDYNRSVTHHLKKPEKLKKALIPYRDQIMIKKNALQQALEDANKEPEEIKAEYRRFFPTRPPTPPITLYVDSIAPWSIDSLLWWIITDTMRTYLRPVPYLPLSDIILTSPQEFVTNIQ